MISYKIGVCRVAGPGAGKECHTEFQRISFDGAESVVLCRPYTGRMHQIRVHLQYLGECFVLVFIHVLLLAKLTLFRYGDV